MEHFHKMFEGVSVWCCSRSRWVHQGVPPCVWMMKSRSSSCIWPHRIWFLAGHHDGIVKEGWWVRGIVTGTSFRRLVAKSWPGCLAKKWRESTPHSALSSADCVGRAIRLATDLDPRATVLSIDGVGVHDHVLRSAMLGKIFEVESLRGLLPFVRATYVQPCNHWQDEHGRVRQIRQHEGGKQRDPLMPLLFCLAVQCVDGCARTVPSWRTCLRVLG